MATRQDIVNVLRQAFPDVIVDGLDETETGRVIGFVISEAFDDLDHPQRQDLLWKALHDRLASGDLTNTGPIVTMTPVEAELKTADAD